MAAWVCLVAVVELLPGVLDALIREQVARLADTAGALLERLDPDGRPACAAAARDAQPATRVAKPV